MDKSAKKLYLVSWLVLIVLALAGLLGKYAVDNWKAPNNAIDSEPHVSMDEEPEFIEVLEWSTFVDNELEVEFQYPKEWGEIREGGGSFIKSEETYAFNHVRRTGTVEQRPVYIIYHKPSKRLFYTIAQDEDISEEQPVVFEALPEENKAEVVYNLPEEYSGFNGYIKDIDIFDDGRYLSFRVDGYEFGQSVLLDLDWNVSGRKFPVFVAKNIYLADLFWFEGQGVLVVTSHYNASLNKGADAIYVGTKNEHGRLKLEEILSLNEGLGDNIGYKARMIRAENSEAEIGISGTNFDTGEDIYKLYIYDFASGEFREREIEKIPEGITNEVEFNENLSAYIINTEGRRKLVLRKNGREITVENVDLSEVTRLVNYEYYLMGNYPEAPKFSSSGNFLFYEMWGYEWSSGYIYDVINEKKLGEKFSGAEDWYGFTAGEEYFYNCAYRGLGITTDPGQIYKTDTFELIFEIKDVLSDWDNAYYSMEECEYRQEDEVLYFKIKNNSSKPATITEIEFDLTTKEVRISEEK